MKISDLQLPISDADAKAYAIVFDDQMSTRLAEVWGQYGSQNCVPMPRRMTDGRWMLCADVLTEVMPGGLLHQMWAHVDVSLVGGIEVIGWQQAISMLLAPQTL